MVTFESPPGGTLDAADWSVVDDGGYAREVASVALGHSRGAPMAVGGAAPRTAAVPADSQEAELVITHVALSSTGSTPEVSHAAPGSDGLTVGGAALPTQAAEASDGTAPSFVLRRVDTWHVEAAFSEPIALAGGSAQPSKDAWDYSRGHAGLPYHVHDDGSWIHSYSVSPDEGTAVFRITYSSILDSHYYGWMEFDPTGGDVGVIVDRADPPNALPAGAVALHVGSRYDLERYGIPPPAPPAPPAPPPEAPAEESAPAPPAPQAEVTTGTEHPAAPGQPPPPRAPPAAPV